MLKVEYLFSAATEGLVNCCSYDERHLLPLQLVQLLAVVLAIPVQYSTVLYSTVQYCTDHAVPLLRLVDGGRDLLQHAVHAGLHALHCTSQGISMMINRK